MATRISDNPRSTCTRTDINFEQPHNARVHLGWLLDHPAFIGPIGVLRDLGKAPRQGGLAWRESALGTERPGHTEYFGDAERYDAHHRALARVIPPKLRCLLPLLVYPISDFEIPPARASSDPKRLKRCCLERLDPNAKLSEADDRWLRRQLEAIDPIGAPTLKLAVPANGSVDLTRPAAMSATSAAVGSCVYFRVATGFPPVGSIATGICESVAVKPFPLPGPLPRERDFSFLKYGSA